MLKFVIQQPGDLQHSTLPTVQLEHILISGRPQPDNNENDKAK